MSGLVVIETHPVQYHAPVYREVQSSFGIGVTAIYGSDFSVTGYTDQEFGSTFAWDTDLLSGYSQRFLSRVAEGGAATADAVSAQGLSEALRELNPESVLLTGYSPRFYRKAISAALRCGAPVLFRAETTDHARDRSPLKRLVRDLALKNVYKRCDALLYVGERSHEHYRRLDVPATDLIFSPYCVDVTPFRTTEADRSVARPSTRAALGIQEDDFVILFSGKLVPRKDPMRIVEAARRMAGAQPVLMFLGSGELEEEVRRAAAREPALAVRFIGFRNQAEMSAYYHAADCLVLPSLRDETWGLVVNEALSHGLPCVVSHAVGCAPDLITDGVTGAAFPAGAAHALAVALERMVPLSKDPATRARCREAVHAYSVNAAARGIAEACQRAAQRV